MATMVRVVPLVYDIKRQWPSGAKRKVEEGPTSGGHRADRRRGKIVGGRVGLSRGWAKNDHAKGRGFLVECEREWWGGCVGSG